jgi:hypothetical protein
MLGEAERGPDRPNFAGDLTGKTGPCRRSWASRDDSSGGDVPDGEAKHLAASAWRQVHCNGGASSTMERWSSPSFLDRELVEKEDQEEEKGWRHRGRGRG